MHYKYKTNGTCSSAIEFDINDNVVTNVQFFGGCNGNLKAISKLVYGMTVEEIEEDEKPLYLLGNEYQLRQHPQVP